MKVELRALLGKLEVLSRVSALYDSYSGQNRAPLILLGRNYCLSQGSVMEPLLHSVASWLVHGLLLWRSCLYWDLLSGAVPGTFGRRSFKTNCLGIPSNLLSSQDRQKHVAKFTAVGFHRKSFSDFLKASLCSLESGINKSIASEQQRCCLWNFFSSSLMSLSLDSSYSFTYRSINYDFSSQFLILLRNQFMVRTQ